LLNWYDQPDVCASDDDKEIVDVHAVLSSGQIKAAFLKKFQGKKKKCPLKLMLPNESKEFPVLSLDELLIMCMELEITSIRQFVFLVLVWLLQVRAHGDQNSIQYSLICFSDLMKDVHEAMCCVDHHFNCAILAHESEWLINEKVAPPLPEQFWVCSVPHKMVFIEYENEEGDTLYDLVQILAKDTFGRYRIFPLFDSSADEFPIKDKSGAVEVVDFSDIKTISVQQLRDFKPQLSEQMPKKQKEKYYAGFQEFLCELERKGYDLEDLVDFNAEEHRLSYDLHTQTTEYDFPEPEMSLRACREKVKFDKLEKRFQANLEALKKMELTSKRKPSCTICYFENKIINERTVAKRLKFKPPSEAFYFHFGTQWFYCELCFEALKFMDEKFVQENTKKGHIRYKSGLDITKTFVPITELQKDYNN